MGMGIEEHDVLDRFAIRRGATEAADDCKSIRITYESRTTI
jgi:hypothetical protein